MFFERLDVLRNFQNFRFDSISIGDLMRERKDFSLISYYFERIYF